MISEEEINYFNPIIREIDSDNSCLFNSIGYLQDKSSFNENTSQNLRNIIANYIKNNPEKYNQTFLNMENEKYQKASCFKKLWYYIQDVWKKRSLVTPMLRILHKKKFHVF